MHPRREPALYLGALTAALNLAVTLGIGGLTTGQAGGLVALITAVGGLSIAATTRPVALGAFTAAVGAGAALVAAFGYELSPEAVGGFNAVLVAVLTFVFRGQVTPAPAVAASAPVRQHTI